MIWWVRRNGLEAGTRSLFRALEGSFEGDERDLGGR